MRVVITAEGAGLPASMDKRFGRAQCLVVVDTETGAVETHDNQVNLNAAQGAGIQTAQAVAQLKVDAVVSGNVGPKAFAALETACVEVFLAGGGTVEEVVEQFKAGQLVKAQRPSVVGHWS